jgi:hypothetical protein
MTGCPQKCPVAAQGPYEQSMDPVKLAVLEKIQPQIPLLVANCGGDLMPFQAQRSLAEFDPIKAMRPLDFFNTRTSKR